MAHFDTYRTASHLPGVINVTTDHLFHGNSHQAFQAPPSLSPEPTLVPPSAFEVLSSHSLDWTSLYFPQLFQQTFIICLSMILLTM